MQTILCSRKHQLAVHFQQDSEGAFHVRTPSEHIHPSKSFRGWEGHNHQKGTSVWILCCCGRKPANESQWLAITAAVLTCQNPPSMSRREASCCCYCSGTPSPGAALRCAERGCYWFHMEAASLLKPASQPSGVRILERCLYKRHENLISTVCPKWAHLPSEYNIYYLYIHAPLHLSCWPLNREPLDHLMWIDETDIGNMIRHGIILLTLYSTEYIEDVYQGQLLPRETNLAYRNTLFLQTCPYGIRHGPTVL